MAHVAIVMATWNGAAHIEAQLASIAAQEHPDWSLFVGDDGSRDDTVRIVQDFAAAHPGRDIAVVHQGGLGATRNFLALLRGPLPPGSCVAFCDQDDVWLPGRLARGLASLGAARGPALWGSRTRIVTQTLADICLSPRFGRPPAFENAIVQSIAGGNTMLMNPEAAELMRAPHTQPDVVTHDWWAYQMISGAGGTVIYDPDPCLLYRQHGGNLIGSNMGTAARLRRARAVLGGRFTAWNDMNMAALDAVRDLLTPGARATAAAFAEARARRGPPALRALRAARVYRQTANGDRSLRAAAFIGRI